MTEADKKNIYNELVNLLTKYCNTCLDKQQMDKILLCAFKLELIDYAEANGYDTSEELWNSIAKTLNVPLDGSTYTGKINKCNCKNGMCALC
jgi:hypothetical protein